MCSKHFKNLLILFLLTAPVLLPASTNPAEVAAMVPTPAPFVENIHRKYPCFLHFDVEKAPAPLLAAGLVNTYNSYYPLNTKGFMEYFGLPRWQASQINGDGGVDVTGTPNSTVVEGATGTLIKTSSPFGLHLSLAVPSDGYVAFDWKTIGGSHIFEDDFSASVQGKIIPLFSNHAGNGRFFSQFLKQGDILQLNFAANASDIIQIDNFRLITNATGVWVKSWSSSASDRTLEQYIAIEKPNVGNVVFPTNIDATQELLSALNPTFTGYPIWDGDGNQSTDSDQYVLNDNTCSLDVEWDDELTSSDEGNLLVRHWRILDPLQGNTMEHSQIIFLGTIPFAIPSKNNH